MADESNPFDIDPKTWRRIQNMPREEFMRYADAFEATNLAIQTATTSLRRVIALFADYPNAETFEDIRDSVQGNARAVMLLETLETDLVRAGQLEAGMVEKGWMDQSERWVKFNESGVPMIPVEQ